MYLHYSHWPTLRSSDSPDHSLDDRTWHHAHHAPYVYPHRYLQRQRSRTRRAPHVNASHWPPESPHLPIVPQSNLPMLVPQNEQFPYECVVRSPCDPQQGHIQYYLWPPVVDKTWAPCGNSHEIRSHKRAL